MDIKSLYTNIHNSKGIAEAKRAADKNSNKTAAAKVATNFFSVNTNVKKVILFLVAKTSADKRLCNGHYLCPSLYKYLYD